MYKEFMESFEKWGNKYHVRFLLFTIIILSFFLLRSAGYFQPYFPISVNFIVVLGLTLAILLLDARSKTIFFVTLVFWVFAFVLRVLKIDVWAERTGIYAYESLLIGVILVLIENFHKNK